MSSLSLENGSMGDDESLQSSGLKKRRYSAKFENKDFSANKVVAAVAMSIEQSEELCYETADISNGDIGSNDAGSSSLISMTYRSARQITAAAYNSAEFPVGIGLEVVIDDKTIADINDNPRTLRNCGDKIIKKRPISIESDNSAVKTAIKRLRNEKKSIIKRLKKKNITKRKIPASNSRKRKRKTKTSSYKHVNKVVTTPVITSPLTKSRLTKNTINKSTNYDGAEHCQQMRKVCEHYVKNRCVKGNSCDKMHEDFPCKFYYLGLKCKKDMESCQFTHGGPLPNDVLVVLRCHILYDPVELVGREFIHKVRLGNSAESLLRRLHDFQTKLRDSMHNATDDIKCIKREDLYFLSEEVIQRLKELNVHRVEQILSLTLLQLNSIGLTSTKQLNAILRVGLNAQVVDSIELSQPLPSSTAKHFHVNGENHVSTENENDDKVATNENSFIISLEKNDSEINCVKTLLQFCSFIIENQLRTAIKKITKNVIKIKSSNAAFADKRREISNIISQLNELNEQNNIFINNKEETELISTTIEVLQQYQDREQGETEKENADREKLNEEGSKGYQVVSTNHDVLDRKSGASSGIEDKNIFNSIKDISIDIGKIIEQSAEAEFSPNRKIAENEIMEKNVENLNDEPPSKSGDAPQINLASQLNSTAIEDDNCWDDDSSNNIQALSESASHYKTETDQIDLRTMLEERHKHKRSISPSNRYVGINRDSPKNESAAKKFNGNSRSSSGREQGFLNNNRFKGGTFYKQHNLRPRTYYNEYEKGYKMQSSYRKPFNDKYVDKDKNPTSSYAISYDSEEDWDKDESTITQENCSKTNIISGIVGETQPNDFHATTNQNTKSNQINHYKGSIDTGDSLSQPMEECFEEVRPTSPTGNCLKNYTPSTDTEDHIINRTVPYKLQEVEVSNIEVNKPDRLDMLLLSNWADPRLLKYRDKGYVDSINTGQVFHNNSFQQRSQPLHGFGHANSVVNTSVAPFGYQPYCNTILQQQNPNRVLFYYLQYSPWYMNLMSSMKIQINRSVAVLARAINSFYKERSMDASCVFDIFKIDCAGELLEIMRNIGVVIDSNGVITEEGASNQYGHHPSTNISHPVNNNVMYTSVEKSISTCQHCVSNPVGGMEQMVQYVTNTSPTSHNHCQERSVANACTFTPTPRMPITRYQSKLSRQK